MLIKREDYLVKIRPYFDHELIKVLTGVRRCGKSILLNQIKEELIARKTIKSDHIISINFEDIEFEKLNTYKKLNVYIVNKIKDDSLYYLFLDEIQHVRSFEKVLASLKATQKVSLFVTGSNSKLLSGRLASLLVGRCIEFKMMPFSFREAFQYLLVNGKKPDESFLFDYMRWGGLPQRFDFLDEEGARNYIEQTFEGIINRDIVTPKSKINKTKFDLVAHYVLRNSGKDFSAKNIRNYFNSKNDEDLEKKAIYRYLDKLEKACLIHRIKRFNISGKGGLTYIEKQYATDMAFRFINGHEQDLDSGYVLENIICNELILRGYKVSTGRTYKSEVDFVVEKNGKKCFIQVAYFLTGETKKREFDAFDPISDHSPKFIISLDHPDMSKEGITHLNCMDFLMGRKDLFLS